MFVVVTHMHSDSNSHFSRFHVIAGNWWRLMEWFYCRQDALLDAHPSLTYTDDTVTSLLIIMPPQSRYGWSCSVSSVSQCPKWMSAFFFTLHKYWTDFDEIPPTDKLITYWVKLYEGQGNRLQQKIWIGIQVLLCSEWIDKFHSIYGTLHLQGWQVHYTHAAAGASYAHAGCLTR